MPETKQKSPDFFGSLNNFVRTQREVFWLATRFLSNAARKRALCMLCLDAEFHRIAATVNDEMVGLIRLQWWRDEAQKILAGETSQQTLAAQSLSYVLQESPEDLRHIINLIDCYDDQLTAGHGQHSVRLFEALLPAAHDTDTLAQKAGKVFSSAQSGEISPVELDALANGLRNLPNDVWPWMCLFEFTGDWIKGNKPGAFAMRWRIWKAFLGGEKRLAKKLRSFC
jgi:hypothetical protein